jgi:hypothetical protein
MNMADTNAYEFKIKGVFGNVDPKYVPVLDADGSVTGFQLPDGRLVQLVAALEVISADETKAEYVTSEAGMTDLGFDVLEYDGLVFNKE